MEQRIRKKEEGGKARGEKRSKRGKLGVKVREAE